MKRFAFLLLAAVMLFSLAGCGNASEKEEFYKVGGMYYPAALGVPVLGEAAAELVSQDFASAAEQITNVGDALYYLKAANLPSDSERNYLADLIATDYDEVGLIYLATSDGGFSTLVYVKVGDTYYPINPDFEDAAWLHRVKKDYVSDTNLDALRKKLAAARPRPVGITVTSKAITMYQSGELAPNYDPGAGAFTQEESPVNHSAKTKGGYNSIIDFYRIPASSGKPQYSEEEIKEMVAADLTLDEAAEKLSTLADVVQYLYLRGYLSESGELKVSYSGYEWGVNRSPHVVFDNNIGNCGGSSNLVNYLLRNDYDEQGYVHEASNDGGHVYNYFKKDGVYYFCDMMEVIYEEGTYSNRGYTVYATENPIDFSEYHIGEVKRYNTSDSSFYIRLHYMYPCEGSHRPVAGNMGLVIYTPYPNILSKEIENTITILYLDAPEYAPIFVDAPPVDLWPEEAQ